MTIPEAADPKADRGLPAFTTIRGGAYFFLPGIRALRFLAGSSSGALLSMRSQSRPTHVQPGPGSAAVHAGKRRFSIYWTWSYPWEANRDIDGDGQPLLDDDRGAPRRVADV